jgi:ABC-type antimicrobial peptide transport system permease subunit
MALGATRTDVHRLVLGEGLRLAGIGAVLGLAGAAALTRLLRGLLFEIQPLDPAAFGVAAAALAVVAVASLVVPARAAGRVDPATTLRA